MHGVEAGQGQGLITPMAAQPANVALRFHSRIKIIAVSLSD
jgi:hypothetical protein